MSLWAAAVLAGVVLAFIQYGWRDVRTNARLIPAALIRVAAVTLVVALLLDAPATRSRPLRRWVALDGSLSMIRGAGRESTVVRAARAAARDADGDSVLVFGDSARRDARDWPRDATTKLQPVVDRAVAAGHPLTVVTDGELEDPDAAASLPAGSRVVVVPRPAQLDLAIASIETPRAAVSGDTIEIRVALVAGSAGARRGSVRLSIDDRTLVTAPVDSMGPFAERNLSLRVPLGAGSGPSVLRAVVSSPGDVEPHNDTLQSSIDLSRAASAVFISTSPDFDARYALAVLRGALSIPTRGYFRVTPTAWRVDGTLAPIPEADVRQALRDAPVAIIHGDTAVFGPPRSAALGPLALVVPASMDEGEWYVSGTPPSPLAPMLAGVAWDSLPPIAVGPVAPKEGRGGMWVGAEAARGRSSEHRPVIIGEDQPRRVAVVVASGLWRWSFRGGIASDAFTAWWGSIFDWLAAERADRRAAVPDERLLRAGDPVRWRRGSPTDSLVVATVRRRNASSRVDSVTLRFAPGASIVETPALAPGLYDVSVSGGRALLVVNPSREWLPRPPRVRSGTVRGVASADVAPRLRTAGGGWAYIAAIVLLCTEWIFRRRRGMR